MTDEQIRQTKIEQKPLKPLRKPNKEGMIQVMLHKREDDPETHPVCHNGSWYHVPMGEEVEVPFHIYEVLHAARKCT